MKIEKLIRGILLLTTPLLAWNVYVYGSGGIMSEKLAGSTTVFPHDIVDTVYLPADASVALAELHIVDGNPETAERLALTALSRNPTNGRVASQLLSLYLNKNQQEKTATLADISSRLWPAHPYTHTKLLSYWGRQQRMDKLVVTLHALLTQDPSQQSIYFPNMATILLNPEYSHLLQPYISTPPRWWNAFFSYIATTSELSLVRNIYQQRATAETALDKTEQDAFINRLLKEKQWQEAYDVWKTLLPADRKKLLGLVFDAGFESKLTGTAFEWQINASRDLKITTDTTQGMNGKKALNLIFNKNKRVNFSNISQRLLLKQGDYQFNIRYRTDNFQTTKGLRWRIRCLDDINQIIAESDNIINSAKWNELNGTFHVSNETCAIQLLRLEASSQYAHDHLFDGSLWFDDVVIKKTDSDIIP